MKALHDVTVRVNSGHAWEMRKGQRVRITFQSIVDFVVFNRDNLSERATIRAAASSAAPKASIRSPSESRSSTSNVFDE